MTDAVPSGLLTLFGGPAGAGKSTLARAWCATRPRGREKRVIERHTRDQHAASLGWPASIRVDTTGQSVVESLRLVQRVLDGVTGAEGRA